MQPPIGQVLYDIVAAVVDGSRPVPEIPRELIGPRPAVVAFRASGKIIKTQAVEGSFPELLADAVADVVSKAPGRGTKALTTIEITLPTGWTKLTTEDLSFGQCNDVRGRYGIELNNGHRVIRMSAMEQIARNVQPERAVEVLTKQLKNEPYPVDTWKFTADEYFIDLEWYQVSRCPLPR